MQSETVSREEQWTTVIKPRNKLFEVNLKEVWAYRDLLTLFVKRDIITQYKQTILGPLWWLIQPALTVIMYMVVFGGIAGIPTDGIPQPLFYLAGVCMWQYFADCLNKTSNTFVSNANIFGKVYFPRLIMPISNTVSNLVRFGIQFGLFVIVYLFYVIGGTVACPNWYMLLFPLLVLMMAGLALGFGIIISSMTTKYRDLQILFTFFVQLWMYATPIVYPLSQVKGKVVAGFDLYNVMCINPVTPVIETFKHAALGAGEFIGWGWLAYSFGFMVLVLALGILIFNKVQKSFMDTV
ncbi:MAG: ABC transporter permease [Bacteroidales bacterium]|jgi:lipopolysaccharide transport system permease protein|nr:ABC transporter permease [Bacteroidales bacterium]MBR3466767.1 ABC transporter permease [Bacteroidales bacterium]MBR4513116.1 ABC transporter permease [Bacteroidales bacterium]